jgi:hypothetical protein
MHAKNDGRPLPALPLGADVAAKPEQHAPAKGLSAVLGTALGGTPGKAQFPAGKLTGAPHRPDKLNKAPKPTGGANRTTGPRTGHR